MKIFQQKVIRCDVDLVDVSFPCDINEKVVVNLEFANHKEDNEVKMFRLIWKLHYTLGKNELVGILVSHAHEIKISEISYQKISEAVSMSALNVFQKLEDNTSSGFVAYSNLNKFDPSATSKIILENLKL